MNSCKSKDTMKDYSECVISNLPCKDSAIWLTKGKIEPRDEGACCFLQDRNMFFDKKVVCPHCKTETKKVENLAKKCDRMLGHDYTWR